MLMNSFCRKMSGACALLVVERVRCRWVGEEVSRLCSASNGMASWLRYSTLVPCRMECVTLFSPLVVGGVEVGAEDVTGVEGGSGWTAHEWT